MAALFRELPGRSNMVWCAEFSHTLHIKNNKIQDIFYHHHHYHHHLWISSAPNNILTIDMVVFVSERRCITWVR